MQPITSGQLKKLQTLWGIHWATLTFVPGGAGDGDPKFASRVARLAFVSGVAKRQIDSAKQLTRVEGELVIAELAKLVPAYLNYKKRRPSRERAREMGTAGRKGSQNGTTLAGEADWARINGVLGALGWTRERLDAFLRSPKSPLRSSGRSEIRTLADANKVWWALKRMAKRNRVPNWDFTPVAVLVGKIEIHRADGSKEESAE